VAAAGAGPAPETAARLGRLAARISAAGSSAEAARAAAELRAELAENAFGRTAAKCEWVAVFGRRMLAHAVARQSWLEAGEADLAVAYLPEASGAIRRQRLYADGVLSVARADHPRLDRLRTEAGFWSERHILMATPGAGRAANRQLDQILAARLAPSQVQVRVPSFLAGAFVAARTEAVATLPARLAETLAAKLGLTTFAPPFESAPIQIDQFWHERVHQDQGHRWLRQTVFQLLGRS
jgi:DNA-binding transcriptional LysR family regulator